MDRRRVDTEGGNASLSGVSSSCISPEYDFPDEIVGGVEGVMEATEESSLAVSIDVLESSRRLRRGLGL
jgi:hypothetical protein